MPTPRGVFVGLATLDIVHRVAAPPGVNRKVSALRQDVAAGGPAAGAAVVYAALGGAATLVTGLGSHPLADVIRRDLREWGVQVVDCAPDHAEPPPVSLVQVVDGTGERSVTSVNAAGIVARPELGLPAVLDGAAVLLLDGHHPALARAAADDAASRGVPVLLDGGSWKPVLADLAGSRRIDIAACSADFRLPEGFAGGSGGEAATSTEARGLLALLRARAVAVTHGADPIDWAVAAGEVPGRNSHGVDGPASASGGGGVSERVSGAGLPPGPVAASGLVPVPRVEARDTLGAGDAFHGALAWSVAGLGLDRVLASLPDVLAASAAVAALRCSVVGPRAWLPALSPHLRSPDSGSLSGLRHV